MTPARGSEEGTAAMTRELETSQEILGIKEFLSVAVKIASTLVGLATLFVLLGFTISMSFISNIRLYGLTNFPQEFYKEAAVKFHADMIEVYAQHMIFASVVFLIMFVSVILLNKVSKRWLTSYGLVLAMIAMIAMIATFFATLKLNLLPESFLGIEGFEKAFIFIVAVPLAGLTFVYLSLNFKDFVKCPFRMYYFMMASFLALFIAVPISYGGHIFDMDVFPITNFDQAAGSTKLDELSSLKSDIVNQGQSSTYFLMGHCTDREIIFEAKPSKALGMILVDKSLIKFLAVSRDKISSLRAITKKRDAAFPIPSAGLSVGPLPEDIKLMIQKEVK